MREVTRQRYRGAIDTASISILLTALGLSGASGLNAWLPLLMTGVLQRTGMVDVAPAWDAIGSTPVLIGLAIIFTLDFIGDKVAVIDHALHAIGTIAHPVAGVVLFDSQAGAEFPLIVSLLLGGGTAGSLHAARATARPIINGASAGIGAPVASAIEDLVSAILVIVAFALPLLAVLLIALLFFIFYKAARRAARLAKRGRAVDASAAPPRAPG